MKSKTKYALAVLLLITAGVFATLINIETKKPPLQHQSYNVNVADTNLSTRENSFTTKLPIISINTGGEEIPGRPGELGVGYIIDEFIPADVSIVQSGEGLNSLQSEPVLNSTAKIRIRGNSSRHFDKPGYLLKFTDENGNSKKQEVMGMAAHDTWVMHGPFLDKTLIRNYMWYNISGMIMEWAPRAMFCEAFVNGEYEGVYVMIEQISVGEGRIELTEHDDRYTPTSYIIRMDRETDITDVYINNFTKYTNRTINAFDIKYPSEKYITQDVVDYISRDFSEFEKSLYSFDYKSFRYGYDRYIDTSSFVDYFIINEVTQNLDAGRYSTYFYKDLRGKLKLAVWDFNNCTNNYIENQTAQSGFFMRDKLWYFMLIKDEDFVDQIIRRYQSLRKDVLSDEYLEGFIDESIAYLGTAITRNFEVWGYTFEPEKDLLPQGRQIGSYDEAVQQYKRDLFGRLHWLDDNIHTLYSYCHPSVNKKFNG